MIQLSLLSTNPVPQGGSASLDIHWKWAVPTSQTQTLRVNLDADRNPLNGNEQFALTDIATGTTSNQIGSATIHVPVNVSAGSYSFFATMTAGARSRTLYAAGTLTVLPGTAPSWLDFAFGMNGNLLLGINGSVGQRIVLSQATGLDDWQPLATNTATGGGAVTWTNGPGGLPAQRFYRSHYISGP